MCWIQSVSSFPDGFFLLLFYTLETVSLSAFASAELGQPFHSYPAGQIEWKQDSPQGEPRLAQSAPLKGHSGPWDRATRPLLAGVEEMENACVMLSLCVFEEMCCWFNQAFRPFFDWFRKHFLLGLLFCLFSYFCLRFFFFFFFFQVPIIPVVFSSYSNFYLRKEKQFKSGNCPQLFNLCWVKWQ